MPWLFSYFPFFIPHFRSHPQTLHPCLYLINPNLLCFSHFQRAKARTMHWNSPPVGQHHCTGVSYPDLSGKKRQIFQGLLLKQLCPSFQHLPGTSPSTGLNPWGAAWEGNTANLEKETFPESLQKVFPKSNSTGTTGVTFARFGVTCAHFQRAACREISHITHSPGSTD